MTCSRIVQWLMMTCSCLFPDFFMTCSWLVLDLFIMTCSWHVDRLILFTMTNLSHVHDICFFIMACSWHVHDLFLILFMMTCSWLVCVMFIMWWHHSVIAISFLRSCIGSCIWDFETGGQKNTGMDDSCQQGIIDNYPHVSISIFPANQSLTIRQVTMYVTWCKLKCLVFKPVGVVFN